MDRILVLVGVVIAVQCVDLDTCFDISDSFNYCCLYGINKTDEAILNECGQELGEAHVCDYNMCYGEKKGYIMANKTINRIVLEGLLLQEYENNTNIFNVVNEKCLNGDINSLIQEDFCYLWEIAICVHFYTMMKCDKWLESDECKKVKGIIRECEKIAP